MEAQAQRQNPSGFSVEAEGEQNHGRELLVQLEDKSQERALKQMREQQNTKSVSSAVQHARI